MSTIVFIVFALLYCWFFRRQKTVKRGRYSFLKPWKPLIPAPKVKDPWWHWMAWRMYKFYRYWWRGKV